MAVSDQLRTAIADSDETHYRIGKETSIAPSVLDRFRDGTTMLGGRNIDRLCEYFGLELRPKTGETASKQAAKKPATKRKRPKKNAD